MADGPVPAVPKRAGPETNTELPLTATPSGKPGTAGTAANLVIVPNAGFVLAQLGAVVRKSANAAMMTTAARRACFV